MTPAMVSAVASSVSAMVRSTIPCTRTGHVTDAWPAARVAKPRGRTATLFLLGNCSAARRVVACRQGSGVEA